MVMKEKDRQAQILVNGDRRQKIEILEIRSGQTVNERECQIFMIHSPFIGIHVWFTVDP